MLKRMFSMNSNILSQFYISAVIPSVIYNCYNTSVWGNCQQSKLDKLNDIHAKAAKVIFKLPDTLPTDECLQKVNWMPISYLYKHWLLCIMHKVYNKTTDPDVCCMFKSSDSNNLNTRRKHQLSISPKWSNDNRRNSFLSRGISYGMLCQTSWKKYRILIYLRKILETLKTKLIYTLLNIILVILIMILFFYNNFEIVI